MNFCYLVCAMETQSGLNLVCSGDTLLLCASDVTQDCIDALLCNTKKDRQRNETGQDIFLSLREALWNHLSSNCSFNNGHSRNHILDLQNITDILKLTDCWRHNMKSTNYTLELIYSAMVFLSIVIMFLSYLCLKKTLTQYLRKQRTLMYVRPNQPNNVQLL